MKNFEIEFKEDKSEEVEMTNEYIIVTFNISDQSTAMSIWVFSEDSDSSTIIIRDLTTCFIKEKTI